MLLVTKCDLIMRLPEIDDEVKFYTCVGNDIYCMRSLLTITVLKLKVCAEIDNFKCIQV